MKMISMALCIGALVTTVPTAGYFGVTNYTSMHNVPGCQYIETLNTELSMMISL